MSVSEEFGYIVSSGKPVWCINDEAGEKQAALERVDIDVNDFPQYFPSSLLSLPISFDGELLAISYQYSGPVSGRYWEVVMHYQGYNWWTQNLWAKWIGTQTGVQGEIAIAPNAGASLPGFVLVCQSGNTWWEATDFA